MVGTRPGRYISGVSEPDLVTGLAAAGVLSPGEGAWTEQQRWIVEAGARLQRLGVDTEAIVRIARLGGKLAQLEVDAVVGEVGEGVEPEAALERQSLRRRAITRLIAAVRHASVSRAIRRLTGIGDQFSRYAGELLHVPSALYVAQHGLNLAVRRLRIQAEESGDAAHALFLGRLLIGVGRYAEASRWLELATSVEPALCPADRGVGLAHLAVARIFLGHEEPGLADCAAALQAAPDSALVLAMAAVVHSFEAGQAKDFARAAAAVARVLELLDRSRQSEPGAPLEHLEALVARGRISLLMPQGLGVYQRGLDDLRRVLPACQAVRAWGAPAGADGIFELHAAYFLGMALSETDPAEAAGLLQRVVVIDPACPFAERAYRRIGMLATNPGDTRLD